MRPSYVRDEKCMKPEAILGIYVCVPHSYVSKMWGTYNALDFLHQYFKNHNNGIDNLMEWPRSTIMSQTIKYNFN